MRSGPGAARTILLFHIISASPSKQPRMVRAFLKVHTRPRLGWRIHCGVEVTESRTNKQLIMQTGVRKGRARSTRSLM